MNRLPLISNSWRFLTILPTNIQRRSFLHCSCRIQTSALLPPVADHKIDKQNRYVKNHRQIMASGISSSPSKGSDSEPKARHQNRLAFEKSPYLLQHASNPVDWYPWGEEAFQKAKKENKMIFLSVGYSTCHWCHVMERESFENENVAAIMNEHFVNIKVDREERPDVDKIYMIFVQATTGGGGWPMSVWLTPDLKPILGGTYFPPDDRYYGQPGFATILKNVAQQWQENQEKVKEQGTRILDILMQSATLKVPEEAGAGPPSSECIHTCFEQLTKTYDKEFGGFGRIPKFPQPVNFNFLFRMYAENRTSEEAKSGVEMAVHTLRMMAKGGIHDHISQGFHRYSTDGQWHVPHFEKMLYDQSQLVVSYLEAYQISQEEFFADVARDILEYVARDLSDKKGGFYSAEDADSFPSHESKSKQEGAFYVWTEKEIKDNLNVPLEGISGSSVSLADVFCKHYDVRPNGNVDPIQDPHDELKNQNVLIVRGSLEDTAQYYGLDTDTVKKALVQGRKIMYDVRLKRPRPHLDDKFVASWNGLMVSGFARAGQVLKEECYTERAMEAAKFIRTFMFNEETGELLRSAYKDSDGSIVQISRPIVGVLEDYTFVIRGLLDLYEACYDPWCLEWASQLQETKDNLFWDTNDGAYFNSVHTDSSIVLRLKEDQDGAEPSSNSVAVSNLVRLSNYLGDIEFRNKATKVLGVFEERLTRLPLALPEMVCGLMYLKAPPLQIIIAGQKEDSNAQALLNNVHSKFLPFKTLVLADGNKDSILYQKLDILPKLEVSDQPTAYICENYACSSPVASVSDLEKLLCKKED